MVTILPYSALIMWRSAARVHASGPRRLIARIVSQNSGVVSTNGIGFSQPPQFTSTCNPPPWAATPPLDESTAGVSGASGGRGPPAPPGARVAPPPPPP